MALESSVQELKEPVEDETSEDQPALDPMTINLDPSPGSTIPQSTATLILPPWSSMKWGMGSIAPETRMGTWGSSWDQAQREPINELARSERLGPVYADSVKERMVPKVQVEETLCPVGTGPPSMAFKEKEEPDTLSATKGQLGKTSEGFRQSLGTGFTQPIHPSYTQQLKLEPPVKHLGQRRPGMSLVNARRTVSSFEPFFCGGLCRDCCFEVGWGGTGLGQCLTLGSL